jgi:glutamate N-acetyltransferase/amino-acid N-acetyltransferase
MAKHPKAVLSPLAPDRFPDLAPVKGVRLAAGHCGIRGTSTSLDLMLAAFDKGTTAAGVFTRSSTAGAPVRWCRKVLPQGQARALVVNSGNANVYTGKAGDDAVKATVGAAAKLQGTTANRVFIASTGVIGEPLPVEKVVAELPKLHKALDETAWLPAAEAIMTTDTFPKGATRQVEIEGHTVTLSGMAKGSGMIAPDMATMLAYVFTDAAIGADALQAMLQAAADASFNCITVDSDTSTSDTLQLFATGQAGHERIDDPRDRRLKAFRAALDDICLDLAHQVVRDGEGAQKFIEVTVTGARSSKSARRIALAIANSPLVKTAIAGGDANWGRIVMAVGKSGEEVAETSLTIHVGGHPVAIDGAPPADYDETPVAQHMAGRNIVMTVDVGLARGRATVWTCDLTHGYIDINAEYRT